MVLYIYCGCLSVINYIAILCGCTQVVVEVKRFEVNVSRGLGPVSAELALNGNVYVEVKDIMGPVS